MKAVGAYLRTLRDWNKFTQKDVAQELEVSTKQVERWEKGNSDPASSALIKFIKYVNGNVEHVAELLTSETATADEGERKAREWITSGQRQEIKDKASGMSPEKVQTLINWIREFRDNVDVMKQDRQVLGEVEQIFLQKPSSLSEAYKLAPSWKKEQVIELVIMSASLPPDQRNKALQFIRYTLPDYDDFENYLVSLLNSELEKEDQDDSESPPK